MIELLTVFAIMAVLMGVAFGYLRSAGKKLAVAASASTVETVLRLARDSARGRGVPSRVEFDRASSTVWAAAQELVGEWHFERDRAGFGNSFTPYGAATHYPEHLAMRWGGFYSFPTGQRAWLDCGTSTAFDARGGFLVEAAIWIDAFPRTGKMVVMKKGNLFSLSVNSAAELEGEVALDGGKVVVATKGLGLRASIWWEVGLEYDGERLRIHVSGVERASASGEGYMSVDAGAPFWISDNEKSFQGYMDEVRYSVLVGNTRRELPDGVLLEEDYPSIRFDRDGNLDLQAMARAASTASGDRITSIELPLEVVVTRASGETRDRAAVSISFYGAITRRMLDAPPPAATIPKTPADPASPAGSNK